MRLWHYAAMQLVRGCVAAIAILLSLPSLSQCTYSLGYSGAFRASYLDIVIDNNDLWAATSYGVQLFDRSVDPPALVASIAVPGKAHRGAFWTGDVSPTQPNRRAGVLRLSRRSSRGSR